MSDDRAWPDGALFGSISTTRELREATCDAAWIRALLEFESALALSERDAGVVPDDHARRIAETCARTVIDPAALASAARASGTPVAPVVGALSQAVGAEASGWVHFGATSQDALDTAAMLVTRRCLSIVLRDLAGACRACAEHVSAHGGTIMTARTLLQPALPTTFALKAAGWLDGLLDSRSALARVRDERLAVQLGGAAGTLAALGPSGPEVVAGVARRLGLREPRMPWHASRARIAEVASALAIASGTASKIALDVVLLAQSEVGEVAEQPRDGAGTSSTLPHKRNPAGAVAVGAASRRAAALAGQLLGGLAHEHERAAGAWQSEWESLGELLRSAGGAVARVAELLSALEVDVARMRANLDATDQVLLAERIALRLSPRLGREAAHELLARASRAARAPGGSLRDALVADPVAIGALGGETVDELLDPATYLGSAAVLAARALADLASCDAAGDAAAAVTDRGDP
ncbi:MAG: adenylosuccinate lyase family protein [Actinomycetota bacterium]|nr:adenylosuccinate lyase family protein [Actinomycetota bacterium]